MTPVFVVAILFFMFDDCEIEGRFEFPDVSVQLFIGMDTRFVQGRGPAHLISRIASRPNLSV